MTKLQHVLKIVNEYESQGKTFFNRNSDDSMSINVRDPRLWGGNPNTEHWANARMIEALVRDAGARTSDIKIDKQSGTLVIKVIGIYKCDPATNPEFDASVGE